jgi:hypothetical protein
MRDWSWIRLDNYATHTNAALLRMSLGLREQTGSMKYQRNQVTEHDEGLGEFEQY